MGDAPNRIRDLRLSQGLSLAELAEKSGVPKNSINLIERGEQELTVDKMRRIAAAMGLRASALLNDADVEFRADESSAPVFEVLRGVASDEYEDLASAARGVLALADAMAARRTATGFAGEGDQLSRLAQLWNGMDREGRARAVELLAATGFADAGRRYGV